MTLPLAYAIYGINASGNYYVECFKRGRPDWEGDDQFLGDRWAGNVALVPDLTPAEAKARWLADNIKKGEKYAGLVLSEEGDYHLALALGTLAASNWHQAMDWARRNGDALPTRQEQALLFANLKHEFEPHAYWSCEQHADNADCVWYQHSGHGLHGTINKSASLRARAVRRIPI